MNEESRTLLAEVGKAQIEGLFDRQREGPVLDDADFLPLVGIVLMAFDTTESDNALAEELLDFALAVYDRMCKENDPTSTTAENQQLMLSYLVGKRHAKRRRR